MTVFINKPKWTSKFPWQEMVETAEVFGLSPILVASLIRIESRCNTWATRYEPDFRWVTDVTVSAHEAGTTAATELVHQKTSWGLLQLMGGTARDMNYEGALPKLCDPVEGMYWGCLYLFKQWERYDKNLTDTISAYNAGSVRRNLKTKKYSNQLYVDRVLEVMASFK